MVWEKNTAVIVMITNVYEKHKKKCEQYWQNEGEARYGKLSVQLLSVEELAYWTIRKFTIKNTKVSRKVSLSQCHSCINISLPTVCHVRWALWWFYRCVNSIRKQTPCPV